MRKLGVDYGDRRIGLSISDPMAIIASSLETYESKGLEKDTAYIADIAAKQQADTIVIGLPLNMDGSMGDRTEKTKIFAESLKNKTKAKIVFMDERLSTVASEKILIDAGARRDKRKQVIDKVAATIILQNYLDKVKY